MDKDYAQGNRLPVPSKEMGPHFMYSASIPKLNETYLKKIVDAAKDYVRESGLFPAQIEVLRPVDLQRAGSDDALAVWAEFLVDLGISDGVARTPGSMSVMVCEWAAPHVDETFAGIAFMNVVLHTGPFPYIMQTLHTKVAGKSHPFQEVVTNSRTLKVGDAIIFDPTTAHCAMPLRPHQDSLLIMLQIELKDESEQDRENILKNFPRIKGDADRYAWADLDGKA